MLGPRQRAGPSPLLGWVMWDGRAVTVSSILRLPVNTIYVTIKYMSPEYTRTLRVASNLLTSLYPYCRFSILLHHSLECSFSNCKISCK